MTTKTKRPQKSDAKHASLKRRIRQFYAQLNRREFQRCFEMIDPCVREKPSSVTLLQYVNSLSRFMDNFGTISISKVSVALHLNEPNKLYDGRDFAMGKTIWTDASETQHEFLERWVCDARTWYTRSTGYVVPAPEKAIK